MISKCLLGENCRYDGKNNFCLEMLELQNYYNLIPICPEQLGGLPTPREPNEIIVDKVKTIKGVDNTDSFKKGAIEALDIAKKNSCTIAILKSKSPSCGNGKIYDGSFTHTLIDGDGITCKLLKENNIKIYNEINYKELLNDIK